MTFKYILVLISITTKSKHLSYPQRFSKTTAFTMKFLKFYHFTIYFSNQCILGRVNNLPAFFMVPPVLFRISLLTPSRHLSVFSGYDFQHLFLVLANTLDLDTTNFLDQLAEDFH